MLCELCCDGSLAGGSLPSSPRGRKRSNHRPQTEDSLWKTQLGQRVYQYRIKAPGVSASADVVSTRTQLGKSSIVWLLLHKTKQKVKPAAQTERLFRKRMTKAEQFFFSQNVLCKKQFLNKRLSCFSISFLLVVQQKAEDTSVRLTHEQAPRSFSFLLNATIFSCQSKLR